MLIKIIFFERKAVIAEGLESYTRTHFSRDTHDYKNSESQSHPLYDCVNVHAISDPEEIIEHFHYQGSGIYLLEFVDMHKWKFEIANALSRVENCKGSFMVSFTN